MKSLEQNFEKSISSKERYITKLKYYRHDCIDDLPPEKISLDDPNYYKYKCRGNYFHGLVGVLSLMLEVKIVKDPEMIKKVNDFIQHACNEIDFSKFVSKEEIDRVNKFLDEIIEHLS